MNFNRVTFQYNNEYIIIIFGYLMVSVITMCNLINNENKWHRQAIKTTRETTNNQ